MDTEDIEGILVNLCIYAIKVSGRKWVAFIFNVGVVACCDAPAWYSSIHNSNSNYRI